MPPARLLGDNRADRVDDALRLQRGRPRLPVRVEVVTQRDDAVVALLLDGPDGVAHEDRLVTAGDGLYETGTWGVVCSKVRSESESKVCK